MIFEKPNKKILLFAIIYLLFFLPFFSVSIYPQESARDKKQAAKEQTRQIKDKSKDKSEKAAESARKRQEKIDKKLEEERLKAAEKQQKLDEKAKRANEVLSQTEDKADAVADDLEDRAGQVTDQISEQQQKLDASAERAAESVRKATDRANEINDKINNQINNQINSQLDKVSQKQAELEGKVNNVLGGAEEKAAALQEELNAKLNQFQEMLDVSAANFYPMPSNPLAQFSEVSYGGNFRYNFKIFDVAPLEFHASFMYNVHVSATSRIDTMVDYSFNFGGGWELPLLDKLDITPRVGAGFVVHTITGPYEPSCGCNPAEDSSKQRYFIDPMLQVEAEFAYDTSDLLGGFDSEFILSPSLMQVFEQDFTGLALGVMAGFRFELPDISQMSNLADSMLPNLSDLQVYDMVQEKALLAGRVVDSLSGQILDVVPTLLDSAMNQIPALDAAGFAFLIDPTEDYTLSLDVEGYQPFDYLVEGKNLAKAQEELMNIALAPQAVFGVQDKIVDRVTNAPIPGVEVLAIPKDAENLVSSLTPKLGGGKINPNKIANGTKAVQAVTNSAGDFTANLQPDTEYDLLFQKEGYFTERSAYSTVDKLPGVESLNSVVDLRKAEVGAVLDFGDIQFQSGSSKMTGEGEAFLDNMAQFLIDNPNIVGEVGAHTDSQGDSQFNMNLSQERAQSAIKYLFSKGVPKDSIVPKGYGETKLVNNCSDGVPCSAAQHRANRRIELRVTAIK